MVIPVLSSALSALAPAPKRQGTCCVLTLKPPRIGALFAAFLENVGGVRPTPKALEAVEVDESVLSLPLGSAILAHSRPSHSPQEDLSNSESQPAQKCQVSGPILWSGLLRVHQGQQEQKRLFPQGTPTSSVCPISKIPVPSGRSGQGQEVAEGDSSTQGHCLRQLQA